MARKAKAVECDEQSRLELERLSKGQSAEMRLVRRARMVLGCLDGKQIKDIAAELGEQEDISIKWRDRFLAKGIGGLHDAPRPGKPVTYDIEWKKLVLEKLDEKPPNNLARWDGPTLAAELGTLEDAVQRFLKKDGIQLARMRTWCISTDPKFAVKAADIVGLYLNPPENAVVISVDEKPSIQALSRVTGVVKTSNGKIVTAIKSTYKRNGTQNLFAAFEVATGVVHGQATKTKKRVDFISFMDDVLAELQGSETTEYHVILDNYCIHKRCDEWLSKIEIWFNIMTRKVLWGASFDSTKALAEAIAGYISYYNESAEPFVWRKHEVVGSQIKDKLSKLR